MQAGCLALRRARGAAAAAGGPPGGPCLAGALDQQPGPGSVSCPASRPAEAGAVYRLPVGAAAAAHPAAAEPQPFEVPQQPAGRPAAVRPVLDIYGGGMFFYWKAGVLQYLQRHHDLSGVLLRGSSSGAVVAALAASGVDLGGAAARAGELLLAHGVYDRPWGVAGRWGAMVREGLEELLPEDCHARCSGRVQLRVTALRPLRPLLLDSFESKADLIDACLASVHLPVFLDGRFAARFRGMRALDGAFSSWLPRGLPFLRRLPGWAEGGSNSPCSSAAAPELPHRRWRGSLAALDGGAHSMHSALQAALQQGTFVLDYLADPWLGDQMGPRIGPLRFGSVRLRSPEQLQQLMEQGFHYGQRLQQAGVWAAWLGAAAGQAQQGFKAGAAAVG